MNTQNKGLRLLIRSAILQRPEKLPEDFSLAKVMRMITAQQITSLVLQGAFLCGIPAGSSEMQTLLEHSCLLYTHSSRQITEVRQLCAAFDEQKIDYLLLKGCNLKELYPEPHMREMADADVLIRVNQYDKIKPIMKRLDYVCGDESDHELHWGKPTLKLELHKRLIPANNRRYFNYFQSGWKRAVRVSDDRTQYAFSKEDELIFYVAHFAKHYRDGGIGAKHLTDLWLFRKNNPELKLGYVMQELKLMGLDEFYLHLCETADVWFGDGKETEITELITDTVFASGAFGNHESKYIASAARLTDASGSSKRGRSKRIFNLFFPPFATMKRMYPILKKIPILLPVMWVVRWVHALICKWRVVQRRRKEIRMVTPEIIDGYLQALKKVGLSFDENTELRQD